MNNTIKQSLLIVCTAFSLSACERITQVFGEKSDSDQNTAVSATDTAEGPKTVAWLTLGEIAAPGKRLLSGKISAVEATQLAFESSGQINTIKVKLGQHFRQGQTLATLDNSDYRLQLQQASANYTAAVAVRNQARTEVRRRERLVASGAVSKAQVDAYRLQLKSAQESVNSADAQLKLTQSQLKKTDLIAPFDGVVTAKLGEIGQLASPGTPIFTVEATQAPEISLSIPENLMASVKPQQAVVVTFPARQDIRAVSGSISAISAQATLGAFPVKITLNNAPEAVKVGMTAEVVLSQPMATDGFNIPPSALGAGQNNAHFVYRIVGNETQMTLDKVPVSIDNLSEHYVRIHGKLSAGDKIVRSGWGFVSANQPVKLMNMGARLINP